MQVSYSSIIFDCDGVLFDSNDLKVKAFRNILCDYDSELVEIFIDYHKRNGGISRYVKLEKFFTEILNIPLDEKKFNCLVDSFGEQCRYLYQIAPLTPSCLDVLGRLRHKGIALFVASGSDETELRDVFSKRGIDKYFGQIYGSPKTKHECVHKIVEKLDTQQVTMLVGDAESDWLAAMQAGLDFVFMSEFSEVTDLMCAKSKEYGFTVIKTLEDLLPIVLNE